MWKNGEITLPPTQPRMKLEGRKIRLKIDLGLWQRSIHIFFRFCESGARRDIISPTGDRAGSWSPGLHYRCGHCSGCCHYMGECSVCKVSLQEVWVFLFVVSLTLSLSIYIYVGHLVTHSESTSPRAEKSKQYMLKNQIKCSLRKKISMWHWNVSYVEWPEDTLAFMVIYWINL